MTVMRIEKSLLPLSVIPLINDDMNRYLFLNILIMKQLIKTSILLLALLLPAIATAHDFKVGGIYYNINGNEAIVTYKGQDYNSYNNEYSGSVVIPATVTHNGTTYTVTGIGYAAFWNCTGLTSIDIPNSVTSIGVGAFEGCTGLTSIVIPNRVTEIGNYAFYECAGLTSIVISNSVTTIGLYAFYGCTGLTSIVIPNSVTTVCNRAFEHCTGLTSIVIPNSVTEIGFGSFLDCTGLTSIVVESGNPRYDSRNSCNAIIETASNTLIAGCNNTTIPNSVTAIGYEAFYNCTGLISIDIPNSVISIGDEAFYGCTGLNSVNIPNSVTSIGERAFVFCTGLTNINIPNSVISIGASAFYDCTGLTSIDIPNSVTSIGGWAFSDCIGLTDVYCYIADLSRVRTEDGQFYLSNADYSGRTLHVLQGTAEAYQADWDWYPYFGQIVEDIFLGDVNRDLEINIADVNAVINMILGGNTGTPAADVNGDGEINIADINAVIDIILSGTQN